MGSVVNRFYLQQDKHALALVDEAGTLSEGTVLCALTLSNGTVVLVGDPRQLCVMGRSDSAKARGVEVSLMERLQDLGLGIPMIILEEQYRMVSSICRVVPRSFMVVSYAPPIVCLICVFGNSVVIDLRYV